ncbi:MAG: carbon-nitrogen hydrolase family protein [Sneathiella sp.]|nr:carbon-nitrogen hydrolase family protein [Sneathiella sp.]
MIDKLPIAIAQSLITKDVEENGNHIRELMAQAHKSGARLIHFPEGALSGYVKTQITDWNTVNWDIVRNELLMIMEVAKSLGIWTVLGCSHKLTEPNRPHNSLFIISDRGEMITRYDKRYCSQTEMNDWYSPGQKAQTFDVDGFRFGCALCIEIQFAEVFSEYERLDTDCVLFSAYSEDPIFWIQAQGYAATNNMWFSVPVPAQCGAELQGGLIGPNGYGLSRCHVNTQPHVQMVELDRKNPELQTALTKARPWRRKARLRTIYEPGITGDIRSGDSTNF